MSNWGKLGEPGEAELRIRFHPKDKCEKWDLGDEVDIYFLEGLET